ncbi:hypothetical protein CBR_g46453 [Chara braunii]|uniref:Phosphatidate cytidylyltransferase n=1 Tax=Chara braunii TaxID=69332 RepID=A0A388M0R9_CHABU|nr:hypothetical protein CBR_g46453 [Chara braunii]|eukprot:GBG88082.1 hypothetical protein CBR_g46453 [Chara braunii]
MSKVLATCIAGRLPSEILLACNPLSGNRCGSHDGIGGMPLPSPAHDPSVPRVATCHVVVCEAAVLASCAGGMDPSSGAGPIRCVSFGDGRSRSRARAMRGHRLANPGAQIDFWTCTSCLAKGCRRQQRSQSSAECVMPQRNRLKSVMELQNKRHSSFVCRIASTGTNPSHVEEDTPGPEAAFACSIASTGTNPSHVEDDTPGPAAALGENSPSPPDSADARSAAAALVLLRLPEVLATSNLVNRVIYGSLLGAGALSALLMGGWVYTGGLSIVTFLATREYFGLVMEKGIARGMKPPPPIVTKVCTLMCSAMPLLTMYYNGRVGAALTTAAFVLVSVLLLQPSRPRFAQFSSVIFGLFYCGYLPSFWVKLRCGLNVPAVGTHLAGKWPVFFGGRAHWTVGLLATMVAMSCVVAADTGAFMGGKSFGRTPLSAISPKKTVEGALSGFAFALGVAVLLSKLLQWPVSLPGAAMLAALTFISSLFGDLMESMIKRDAGVKDSGTLIPGHGGILDRVDSYVFTGALVYSFVKIGLPLFGL